MVVTHLGRDQDGPSALANSFYHTEARSGKVAGASVCNMEL